MNWWTRFHEQRIQRVAEDYLRGLRQADNRHQAELQLRAMARQGGVLLGRTASGIPVTVPLDLLTHFGITVGASGSGKTMFDCLITAAMLEAGMPFGLIDAKGELFDRTLYLISKHPETWEDVVVIDFGNRHAISPYNILQPIGDFDYFVTRRTETLRELLPAQDRLSLRGAGLLKHCVSLLAECGQTMLAFDRLLTDGVFRSRLLQRSRRAETKYYFHRIFPKEPPQTVGALQARIGALFTSASVRLALGGKNAPDFRRLQDSGKITLINCGGANITRGVRTLLQSIILSDIRQSIFSRANKDRYIWRCDEAQNLFQTPSQQEDVMECLNMSRSFGSFFHFICQHLETAVHNKEILQILHQNLRWSFTMRSLPRDCSFLKNHLPVTGRLPKPRKPFQEKAFYTESEERTILHDGIAHLPDRMGYLWLKTKSPQAFRLATATLRFGRDFEEVVTEMKNTPEFGHRAAPKKYRREESEDAGNVFRDMETRYTNRSFKKDV